MPRSTEDEKHEICNLKFKCDKLISGIHFVPMCISLESFKYKDPYLRRTAAAAAAVMQYIYAMGFRVSPVALPR